MSNYTRKFKTMGGYTNAFSTLENPHIAYIMDDNKLIFYLDNGVIVGLVDENNVITLDESLTEDDYILRYEDEKNKAISNFKSFNISSLNFIQENTAPYTAAQIGVYTTSGSRIGRIMLGNLHKDYDTRLYRFGVLSDVHHDNSYDKYFYSGDTKQHDTSDPQSASDFQNAIHYLEQKEDVCMTCICGDLTVQQGETGSPFVYSQWKDVESESHLADLDSYKYNIGQLSPTTPIFVARGNHDLGALINASSTEIINRGCGSDYELWKYYTTPQITDKWKNLGFSELVQKSDWDYQKGYIDALTAQYKKESYYFTKTNSNGKVDVFIMLSLNSNGFWYDNINAYNIDLDIHTTEWLESVLEEYRNNRCFVFMHLFFKDKVGNSGHHYYKNNGTWYQTEEYAKLNAMNNHYKNAIFINGHSHYKWNMQQHAKDANVTSADTLTKEECGYNLHIPSCAYPRKFDPSLPDGVESGVNQQGESEGAIIDVYADYVDVRGIVFKSNEDEKYTNLYEPMAQYRLYVGGKNLTFISPKA